MSEQLTIADMQARIMELETEKVRVKALANRADELADECKTPEGEAILRSEADNLWYVVGEIMDRIERMHRTTAQMSAGLL